MHSVNCTAYAVLCCTLQCILYLNCTFVLYCTVDILLCTLQYIIWYCPSYFWLYTDSYWISGVCHRIWVFAQKSYKSFSFHPRREFYFFSSSLVLFASSDSWKIGSMKSWKRTLVIKENSNNLFLNLFFFFLVVLWLQERRNHYSLKHDGLGY